MSAHHWCTPARTVAAGAAHNWPRSGTEIIFIINQCHVRISVRMLHNSALFMDKIKVVGSR